MVEQKKINNFFASNHRRLKELTAAYVFRSRRYDLDPDAVISEAYLYITEKQQIITEKDIEPYAIKFIQNEIRWTNGKVSKAEGIKDKPAISDNHVSTDTDLEELKCIEMKFTAAEQAYQNAADKVSKIIHEVYFEKGITTSREMAKHFGIDKDSANRLIRNFKNQIHNEYTKIVQTESRV